MVEFEPPKRTALSEPELHRALTELGNTSAGLVQAEVLLSNQALAREQDTVALSSWISQMQALGTPEAQRALANMVLDVLPASMVETEVDEPALQPEEVEPVFTSEITIVKSRRELRKRRDGIQRIIEGFAAVLAVALSNALISQWLDLSLTDALISSVIGTAVATPILLLLKTHAMHPLLRSAAVFGGWGVYVGAGLILAAISSTLAYGALSASEVSYFQEVIPGFSTELLIGAVIALIISQAIPRKLFFTALLVLGLVAFVLGIVMSPPALGSGIYVRASMDGVLWGSLAMALTSSTILVFGLPHATLRPISLTWQAPTLLLLTAVGIHFATSGYLAYTVTTLLFVAIALSGRDLSIRGLGRLAGLAFLIAIFTLSIRDLVSGPAASILVSILVLVIFDQLFRRSSLHIPSLDTSYGFYGSFQLLTFLTIIISGAWGVPELRDLIFTTDLLTPHELSLMGGALIGLLFGLMRIAVIKRQDREIRNVEFRNMNLDNLLGL